MTAALDTFKNIPETMCWRNAALGQIDRFKILAAALGAEPEVVSHHTSKSIRLPVMQLTLNNCRFYIRDNFYDINVCAVAPGPIDLPMAELFEGVLKPLDWAWYLGEIERARGYSWREWTDEQMDDPTVLRVFSEGQNGAKLEWTKRRGEKDRWAKRMTDPMWFREDWSASAITYEGEFKEGVTLFVQSHPFAEGISNVVGDDALKPYVRGNSSFGVALGTYEQVALVIRRVADGR